MKPGSLYDRIFGFLGQLIALNLLWIVCSLPVITAGASTTALYYCTLKLHKEISGYFMTFLRALSRISNSQLLSGS